MRERIACEFLLIRYVPDVVKGEFTNIGVVVREVARPDSILIRFTRNWSRARALDRDLDTELLDRLEAELSARVPQTAIEGRPLLDVIRSSFSTCLQITETRACLAESLPAEMDRLMKLYVEPLGPVSRPRRGTRGAIVDSMRQAFEMASVWPLMKKGLVASTYTGAGDPLRIDCGYRPTGSVRMFHAVSLSGDLDGAKVLAFSAKRLRDGVRRVDDAELYLTAVVETLRAAEKSDDEAEVYRFGVQTLEQEGVRVATTSELYGMAETAARELNV